MGVYFEREYDKKLIYFLRKDKQLLFIPERYKRNEYIIDKIKSK